MSKVTFKISLAVSIFSILITGLFVIGIFSFSSIDVKVEDYLAKTEPDIVKQEENPSYSEIEGSYREEDMRYIDLQNYTEYYNHTLIQTIIPIAILFCCVLLISFIILWWVLKFIQRRENERIAAQLSSLQEIHEFTSDDPVLAKAYSQIQKEFDKHITDYKRLHAYLSHEQKNALSLLRANLELKHYEDCFKNIKEISEGIDDLVTLSESGDFTSLETVDIVMLCAEVVDQYHSYGNLLYYEFPDDPLYVRAKPRWILCAVQNLLDNAIKYGADKEVNIKIWGDQKEVHILVEDHGIGISSEQQALIFDDHYRINELHKDGYGIGLSLVRHVCTLCHGSITCTSQPHVGSLFQIHLPRQFLDV